MRTFRGYLFETKFKRDGVGGLVSSDKVDGHDVRVSFGKHQKPRHYDAYFDVNGSTVRANWSSLDPKTKSKIAHTVLSRMHDFIREKKPKRISMHAFDFNYGDLRAKEDMYHKVANHLAKVHGGIAKREMNTEDDDPTSPMKMYNVVEFPNHGKKK